MKTKLISIFVFVSSFCYGQNDTYTYKRKLSNIQGDWYKIIMPHEVFEKTNDDFSDLRIIGITEKKDNIEVPYFINTRKDEITTTEIPFTIINKTKSSKGYYYTFKTNLEEVNELTLDFSRSNFDWKINLEGSPDQKEWFTVLEDYRILSIKNEDADFNFTKVKFSTTQYPYFRLCIQSPENPTLEKVLGLKTEIVEGEYDVYTITSWNTSVENKKSIVNIDLAHRVFLSQLSLKVSSPLDFYRKFQMEYLSDSFNTDKGWKYQYLPLCNGIISSQSSNVFKFEPVKLKRLRIVIDNEDNEALHIKSAEALGYVHEIVARFSKSAATYYLHYGNPVAKKPSYDITYFKEQKPSIMTSLIIGPEMKENNTSPTVYKPLLESKYWLWGIMTIIIILLGGFSLKMIKQK